MMLQLLFQTKCKQNARMSSYNRKAEATPFSETYARFPDGNMESSQLKRDISGTRDHSRGLRDQSRGHRDHSRGHRDQSRDIKDRSENRGRLGTDKRDEPQSFEIETEELDPRVQQELEKLNSCTDEINRLEVQLDDANTVFRFLLSDSTHHLKALSKKIGSCIEKARPFYEAQFESMNAQAECQKAAVQFQRAAGIHAAAKETISLAEERFLDNSGEWQFDNAWQEMLNHATIKVMDAEKQRTASEKEHLARSAAFSSAEAKVKALEKKLSRHIEKSKPYFEQKDAFNKALNSEKSRIQTLQAKICQTKSQYAQSLRNLEDISESIHQRRKTNKRLVDLREDFDSLTYDLDLCHLDAASTSSIAGSQLTISENSGCDSALGSASLVGEGSIVDEDSLQVSRRYSLPEQLNTNKLVSRPPADCVNESKNTQNKNSCQEEISQCVEYSDETLHRLEISEISGNPGQHSNLTGEDENARRTSKTVLLEGSSLSQVEFSRAVEISEFEISLVREEAVGEGQEVEGDEHEEEEDRQGIHSIADLTPIKL
ncbi:SH3 domain-binding protein 5 homolog isoform X2 [Eurytemora carolleeae]|uniref:SH3 domain-binding protein 5 homolog isoform X2 n=1 Tax=Eurytemora carolleeae TaxID=1294199 RepID=UPI000C793502|nr:SH3 domain-binding protein 5 homolog isoform X2 [Eurytemora carolleeae]|eukprot:XP_023329966.1 SH3 domain-binding protein 5 homolog isoform X2 [Eurytemora affinis]